MSQRFDLDMDKEESDVSHLATLNEGSPNLEGGEVRPLFPNPMFEGIDEGLDELDEDKEGEYLDAELDRIFGADTVPQASYLTNLIHWIRNTKQSAENLKALAQPYLEEYERRRRRFKAKENRVERMRAYLALLVERLPEKKFSDVEHRVSIRYPEHVIAVGTCLYEPAEGDDEHHARNYDHHLECPACVRFIPAAPAEFCRVTIELEARKALAYLKEEREKALNEGKPDPGLMNTWAKVLRGKPFPVIR